MLDNGEYTRTFTSLDWRFSTNPIGADIARVHDNYAVDILRARMGKEFTFNMYDRGHLVYSIVRAFKSIIWPADFEGLSKSRFYRNTYERAIVELLDTIYDKDYLKPYYQLAVEENKKERGK
jgi:hypothetical protein